MSRREREIRVRWKAVRRERTNNTRTMAHLCGVGVGTVMNVGSLARISFVTVLVKRSLEYSSEVRSSLLACSGAFFNAGFLATRRVSVQSRMRVGRSVPRKTVASSATILRDISTRLWKERRLWEPVGGHGTGEQK